MIYQESSMWVSLTDEQRLVILKAYGIEYDRLVREWICPYISRHLLSLNPLLACCRRYSRGER